MWSAVLTSRPRLPVTIRPAHLLAVLLVTLAAGNKSLADEAPTFGRDILPILSESCFSCHGPDEKHRKADLRLDLQEPATALKDGVAAIVPGKPDASELIRRITSTDPDEVMPPAKSRKGLTPAQVATFKKWIAAGAPWGKHWSLEKPTRPEVPANGAATAIDAFVLDRLSREGLKPSPEAARHTLARRVALDLTGLPPSPEVLQSFEKDDSPQAYTRLVDRLLGSEHFGERMAMWWLDAARYSDTDGFQADATRTNWPWRDYVVAAFNRNMRFDQFTLEQFAGDLLPNATPDQKLATAFHRNHMTNGEGGRDPEESRVDYVIDRVNTTGTLWLGLTVGCAQCHSHKFDPFSHNDYYSLSAFFNSIDEDGKAGSAAKPYLSYKSPLASRAVVEAQHLADERSAVELAARNAAEPPFQSWLALRVKDTPSNFKAWKPLHVNTLESIEGTVLSGSPDDTIVAGGPSPMQDDYRIIATTPLPRITGLKLEVLPDPVRKDGGFARGEAKHFMLTDIKVQVRRRNSSQIRDISVATAAADYSADPKKNGGYGAVKDTLDDDPRNGWSSHGSDITKPRTAVFALADSLTLAADEELVFEMRHRSTLGNASIARFRVTATDQAGPTVQSVGAAPLEELAVSRAADPAGIAAKLRDRLREQFLADHGPYGIARASLDRAKRQLDEAKKAAGGVNVMVLAERKTPRETNILIRGVWDKKGEKVEPGVPPAVANFPKDLPRDRAGLAKWITSSDNPLTARVMVNHLWQLYFGAGLVRTPDDFGLQGEHPTHPELLDWLAVEFMESGWDIKHIAKLIVTSQTYRQRSDVSPALLARDPENRLLARGARYRLPSWMLRDSPLASAGLLNPAIGGPPVRPYQPDGVWEEMFMGRFKYEPSEGAAQYRRTLYAFWRRAIAPTFLFDSAQRRVCEVRTSRTNTPLQALTLLNDASYLEASRELAQLAMRHSADPAARVAFIYRRVLSRPPTESETSVILRQVARATDYYKAHPTDADKFLKVGQQAADPALDAPSLAANMLAASMILNLDEAITHE
ncbi:PSD1 and planctomycete cytochrome C domain-containing protein [Humisphaera borealis]|uniref:PSD1 domain-containing protein n=1 Tax=Humisphaera borealis TaxID=2807512 RepID=A0A7M2WU41_9BACT|nr:PSD1 and planctomycete cytochrome C domain-containing protein [Humisphaera borealis]QOV88682.1 PSD1 domain-containing protein [Humisphaera borealis]